MKHSSDVWFISFLIIKGNKIAKYDVIERGRVKCYFEISEDDWKKHKLEFSQSEVSKYKQTIEMLKDMGH